MNRQSWQRWLLLLVSGIFGALLIGESFFSSGRWIGQPFPGFFVHENLTVGPYALPGWSGAAAGVESLDHVVAVGGRPLDGRADLYASVRMVPVGNNGAPVAPSIDSVLSKTYPISRPLFMYTIGQPQGAVKDYLDWIKSDAGQRVLLNKGYPPLRKLGV